MKNLDQIRARNALRCAKEDGAKIIGEHGGEVIKKLPSLVLNHGLLATAAYAFKEKAHGWQICFAHLARHLADPEIGIVPERIVSHESLVEFLCGPDATSETLKQATAEVLAWVSFARRFIH